MGVSLRTWVLIALALGSVAPALAQPSTAPPAPSELPVPPPAPPRVDAAETTAAYDRAFALLITEQWEEAATAFAAVAVQSVEPERRGAAAEFARFAREMDARSDGGPKRSSGRASFVATTTLASFYAGFVIDDLLAVEDYKAQTLVVTGVTLGGFAAALFATGGKRITDSMASAYGTGLLVGAGNGLLLAPRLGIEPDGDAGDGEVNQLYLGFGLAAMAVGGAGAMYLADAYDPTPAQASYAGLMGVNGLITVGLGLVIVQPDLDYRNVLTLLALGVRVGKVAVEGWLAAVGDDFLFIDCAGDECAAAAPPGLGEGGLTVRYLEPLAPHLTMNLHGDVARAGGWGALAGTAGNGLGAGAGLELSGKVAALRLLIPWVVYLWRPDLLHRRLPGPRVTLALHADASARRYWMHDDGRGRLAPTGDAPNAARVLERSGELIVRDASIGVTIGAAF